MYTHSSVFLCCPVSRKQQLRWVRPRQLSLCEQAPLRQYELCPEAPVSSRLCRASIPVHTLCTSPEWFSQCVGNVSGKHCSSLNFPPCPAAPGCGSSREEAPGPGGGGSCRGFPCRGKGGAPGPAHAASWSPAGSSVSCSRFLLEGVVRWNYLFILF